MAPAGVTTIDCIVLNFRPPLDRDGMPSRSVRAYHSDRLLVVSRQPLLDGARALLELGADPEGDPDHPAMIGHYRSFTGFRARSPVAAMLSLAAPLRTQSRQTSKRGRQSPDGCLLWWRFQVAC